MRTSKVVITLLVGAILAPPVYANPALGAATADSLAAESAVADLHERAQQLGALGIYRDETTGAFVVVLPNDPAKRFTLDRLGTLAGPVVSRISDYNADAVARVHSQVDALFSSTFAEHTYAAFYDPKDDKIVVNTDASEVVLRDALAGDWEMVKYEAGGLVPLATRWADTSPFWGGAAVTDGTYLCTLGFNALKSGVSKMVTAGHCFPSNGLSVWSPGSGQSMGTFANKTCVSGNDYALIGGASYAPKIYIGGGTSTTGYLVKGAGNPSVGVTYWWSGASTNENTTTVTSTTATGNWGCGAATGLVRFENVERGICAALGGDSGAPLYLKQGLSLYVRGLVVAKVNSGAYCFAIKWTTVSSGLGIAIATG